MTAAGSAFCSGSYSTIPALRFRACVIADSVTGGAKVRSAVQVTNVTHTPRWVSAVSETIVSGRVRDSYNCGKILLRPSYVATCVGRQSFVPDGGYAYARGKVYDYSSRRWGTAYSPVYRP